MQWKTHKGASSVLPGSQVPEKPGSSGLLCELQLCGRQKSAGTLGTAALTEPTLVAAASSSPRYASDLEQARPQTSGEEELQLQLALAMSREEAEKVRSETGLGASGGRKGAWCSLVSIWAFHPGPGNPI